MQESVGSNNAYFLKKPKWVLLILATAAVAFASTLLGIGGGALIVPVLAAFGGLRLKKSVGTSLALIAVVVGVGLVAQVVRAREDVLWGEAGLIVLGAFTGAPIGRWLLRIIPRAMFRYVLAVFLAIVAVRMAGLVPMNGSMLGYQPNFDEWPTIAFAFSIGFVTGVSSTLFGVGGGIVIVPALTLGYAYLGDNFAMARATSLAAIVPISLWGSYLHARKRNVVFSVIPLLLPLSLVCAVLGVMAAYWVHAGFLKLIFAVLLTLMSIKLIFDARQIIAEQRAKRAQSN